MPIELDPAMRKMYADMERRKAWPAEFIEAVDMNKVSLTAASFENWITNRMEVLRGIKDDQDEIARPLLMEYLENTEYFKNKRNPDIKKIYLMIKGFFSADKDALKFCLELWRNLLSAQNHPKGIPAEWIQELAAQMAAQTAARKEMAAQQEPDGESFRRDPYERDVDERERFDRGGKGGYGRGQVDSWRGGRRRDDNFGNRGNGRERGDFGRGGKDRAFDDRGGPRRSRSPMRMKDSYVPRGRGGDRRDRGQKRRSPSPAGRSISRSLTRSRSPAPRRRRSRSRSVTSHRLSELSISRSPSPAGRRRRRSRSLSSHSRSRSRSPVTNKRRRSRSSSRSLSRSPAPKSRRRRGSSRCRSRSHMRSLSPRPRRGYRDLVKSSGRGKRLDDGRLSRSNSRSPSRSRSRSPRRRSRRDSRSRSRSRSPRRRRGSLPRYAPRSHRDSMLKDEKHVPSRGGRYDSRSRSRSPVRRRSPSPRRPDSRSRSPINRRSRSRSRSRSPDNAMTNADTNIPEPKQERRTEPGNRDAREEARLLKERLLEMRRLSGSSSRPATKTEDKKPTPDFTE